MELLPQITSRENALLQAVNQFYNTPIPAALVLLFGTTANLTPLASFPPVTVDGKVPWACCKARIIELLLTITEFIFISSSRSVGAAGAVC